MINNTEIVLPDYTKRGLSEEERVKLINALEKQAELKFTAARGKKYLALPKGSKFNWEEGGEKAVEATVRDREQAGGKGDRGHFHWLRGRQDIAEPLRIHKRIRSIVREEAGKLG